MVKKLTESTEDYLEAILLLSNETDVVRVKDISKKMSVKMPSVHMALHILEDNGFVIHHHYGHVELTDLGRKRASDIYATHQLLVGFLTEILKVPKEQAELDACKMEHVISKQTLSRLSEFIQKSDKYL